MPKFASALIPLALLAACGSKESAEQQVAAPEQTAALAKEPYPAQMPIPSADGVDTVDYSGSYTLTGVDGSQSTLTLDKDAGTYEYASPEGTTSGKYERLDAGRIAITDLDGSAGYFSIASGALYRLSGKSSPFDEIDPGRLYRSSDYGAQAERGEVEPSATSTESPSGKAK